MQVIVKHEEKENEEWEYPCLVKHYERNVFLIAVDKSKSILGAFTAIGINHWMPENNIMIQDNYLKEAWVKFTGTVELKND